MPSISFGSPTVSGQVQVAVSSVVPVLGSEQTELNFNGTQGSAGTDTLGTVGAGKVWYITDIIVGTTAAGRTVITIDIDATAKITIPVPHKDYGNAVISLRTPLKLTATEQLKITSTGSVCSYTVKGVEESA